MGAKVLAAAVAVLACGIAATPAAAERAILGVPTPVETGNGTFCGLGGGTCTLVQTGSPDAFTPPGNGRIVSWWAVAPAAGATVRFRLTHVSPVIPHKTAVVGTSTQTIGPSVVDFATDLPARSGDHLGMTITTPPIGIDYATDSGATIERFNDDLSSPELPDSTTPNTLLEMGAEFVYQPAVTGVAATAGGNAGGESVVLTGDHLTDTTAVLFGATPASSFHIDSNTQITAVTPAASPGTVEVTAQGPGGTSLMTAGDKYTFLAPTGTISPGALDFGSNPLNATSAAQFVTVSNGGTVPIAITSARFDGPAAGDFATTFDNCSGKRIGPGRSCEVDVAFTPTATGLRRATLELDDSLPGSPQDVTLTGTGAAAPQGPPIVAPQIPPIVAPSNFFSLGKLSGTTLPVTVASRGTVAVADASIKAAAKTKRPTLLGPSAARGGPGTVRVKLKLSSAAKKTLKRGHSLKLHARVTFTPDGGTAASKVVTLKVKAPRRKH